MTLTVPHNLPAAVTSFVGREREIADLVDRLTDSKPSTRLVTLTGAGGVGKTRLAVEVAAQLVDTAAFDDGVWLVELASLADPRRIAQVVSGVFSLKDAPDRTYSAVLVDALRPRHTLLLLDNCEHLISASAELAHLLLRNCPRLSILATSREPLGIEGETTRRLPSLERPDPHVLPSLEQLRTFEAVQLFADRAAAAAAEFDVHEANAPAIANVCARLDGIPLALELAAARVRGLSVQQIADRLDDRFRLLGGELRRAAPPRQQTLEATVAWSYDLLTADEQQLFRRLSVFVAGWTLEDAEAVCANAQSLDRNAVLDLLSRLVDKSLVLVEDGPNNARWYRQLETIRHFAVERLRESGEAELIRARHLEYYVDLAAYCDYTVRWNEAEDTRWSAREVGLRRAAYELPNFRAAYRQALDSDQLEAGLRLANGLFTFFWTSGALSEGREWLATLLARTAGAPQTIARAWALGLAAKLAGHHGDDSASQHYAREYLSLPRELLTGPATAHAHTALGLAALRSGDLASARQHATIAHTESRASEVLSGALYLTYIGAVAAAEGNLDEAQALFQQALTEGRALDFPLAIGIALGGLARVARLRGDRVQAQSLYADALGVLRAIGDMPQVALMLVEVAHLALEDADAPRVVHTFTEALEVSTTLGHRPSLVGGIEGVAQALLRIGSRDRVAAERSLRLLGAADRLREPTQLQASAEAEATRSRASQNVGEQRAASLIAEGRVLSLEQAVAQAKAALRELDEARQRTVQTAAGLTPREREVAALLARGCSNQRIAETLVIGRRTAEMHVGNLLAKLGFASRAQLAVWAAEQGLQAEPASTASR